MKRALTVLLGALLLALFAVAGIVVFLGATEDGTRLLAAQAERFLPVRLTGVSGALLREVRVGEVTYELENRRLEIEGLAASVEMWPLLFDNHLIAHFVSADTVTLTTTGEAAVEEAPPALELPYMPLRIDVGEILVERLQLDGSFPMRVAGSASWGEAGLEVHRLNVTSDVVVLTLQGELGTGGNPALTARVNWSLPEQAWGGEGRVRGRVDSFELQHVLRGYVSVDAEGRGDLSNVTEPYVDLQASVADLELGDTAIRNVAGRVSGTLSNLTADLSSRVQAPNMAPFRVNVVAYGPANGPLTLRNVTADALGGAQQAQGSVGWQDGVRVSLGGTASNVALAELREELTGRMDAAFRFLYRDGLMELGLQDLQGTLNQRPIEGAVEVAQLEEGWLFDPVRLSVGDNRLSGRARLAGPTLDVQAQVNAPAMDSLGLGVAGDATAGVRLSGSWPEMNGTVELSSSRLEGFDVALEEAVVQARVDGGVVQGNATADRVSRQQLTLEDARLDASGPLENLNWRLTWQEGEGAGELEQLEDGFELRVARARLDLLDEQWSLRDPTRVLLLEQRVELAPACIEGGGASACVETFAYESGRIETRGALERAPVALLQPWLPIRLGDAGYLEGRWSLAGDPDDLSGDLALAARRLSFVPGDEQEAIDLPDLEADGDVTDGALRLRLAATGEDFSLVGNARLAPVQAKGSLRGTIEASATNLAPLQVFDQRLEEIAGSLQGEVDIFGTPAEPRLEGRLNLVDGRMALNDPDIAFTDVTVRLQLDDSGTFELRGTAMQEEEEVLVTAAGSGLFDGALAFRAAVLGENLQAEHPDWEVTVSPNLNLAYERGGGRLLGRVVVPDAEVRLSTLPTSVPSPSEDVVVVGRQNDDGGNAEPNRIRADVEVVLGEDVVLKALGITAELEGSLQARRDARGQTSLRGTLDITGGELSTQGQTLTIESGTVVYNGPVTRPYIDLRAVRVIEDATPEVTVGLHIRGDANNLTSSVFSDPAMSETRALSYLVLGRDIGEETADDDSGRLVAAAINLGLSRSKGITSELMDITGLDELSAMAEAQNSFAIVAGKRVTDDLYVRYTYNTLSAVGAFLVRYDLGSGWQLEAHSGEQSAMDLMYSFEK